MFALACLLACALKASVPLPALADGTQFVSVIAADLDADGDLDLIASDTALQIHVWVNDGDGHFTRREPVHGTTWQTVPPAPTFEDRSSSPPSCTSSPAPTLQGDLALGLAIPALVEATVVSTSSKAARWAHTALIPRAPPRTARP